jgi:hypothetical protein
MLSPKIVGAVIVYTVGTQVIGKNIATDSKTLLGTDRCLPVSLQDVTIGHIDKTVD